MAYYNSDLDSAKLLAYTRRYGIREPDILKKCRLETLKNRADASIMTMPEEAAFLAFFIKSLGFYKINPRGQPRKGLFIHYFVF